MPGLYQCKSYAAVLIRRNYRQRSESESLNSTDVHTGEHYMADNLAIGDCHERQRRYIGVCQTQPIYQIVLITIGTFSFGKGLSNDTAHCIVIGGFLRAYNRNSCHSPLYNSFTKLAIKANIIGI